MVTPLLKINIHVDFELRSLLRKLHLKHGNTAIHGGARGTYLPFFRFVAWDGTHTMSLKFP